MTLEHVTNSWLAMSSLLSCYGPEDINSSMEVLPRDDTQALMVEELFDPLVHVVPEIVEPTRADPYPPPYRPLPKANLVLLDWLNFTAAQIHTTDGFRRTLLDAIFRTRPKAVVLSEGFGPDLFIPRNVAAYERWFHPGAVRTYPSYLTALTGLLQDLYGYRLCRGYWSHDAFAVLALVPADLAVPGTLHKTPTESFSHLADKFVQGV